MKILDDGTTFRWVYMRKFRSDDVVPNRAEEIKDDGRQKQNCNIGHFFSTSVNK